MKAVLRAAMLLVSVAAIAAAGTASVRAASPEPDLIGGRLDATETSVQLTSMSTREVSVTMAAEDPTVQITPARFTIQPGETVAMAVSANPRGNVSALLETVTVGAGDTSSVTLKVGFPQPAEPPSPLPWIVGALVALLAAAFVARRLVPFARSFEIRRREA